MSVIKKNIYDLTKKDLEIFIKNEKIKLFRVKQIWNWLYVKGVKSCKTGSFNQAIRAFK